ncbi:hypothetical protein QNO09_37275 [Streptomyces sp. 378]|nr:hypothetical protein [Streptomyces sp. 378]MDK1348819.1 hypothetical protein [Streptomyces sp. 378]
MATRKRVAVVGTGTVGSQAAWPLQGRTSQPIDFISTRGRTAA